MALDRSPPPALVAALDDPYDRILAESILGTSGAAAIHRELGAFCRAVLGAELTDVTFCELSVGAGFGLALTDGRRVFLKAWPRSASAPMLRAVHAVQGALAAQRFPAPAVLAAPRRFMGGRAAVHEWLDRGVELDANEPTARRAMAEGLARLVELATPFRAIRGLPRHTFPRAAVWSRPHNALFDFEATQHGAEWIDAIGAASAALARRGVGRLVVGHCDWSSKNVRFEGGAVSAVYDWDALAAAREPVIVGMAAASFPASFHLAVRMLPPPEEMAAFVRDYEAAAGRPFTAAEWRAAGAAATYLLAYTARCQHAGSSDAEPGADTAIGFLRRHAAAAARGDVLTGV